MQRTIAAMEDAIERLDSAVPHARRDELPGIEEARREAGDAARACEACIAEIEAGRDIPPAAMAADIPRSLLGDEADHAAAMATLADAARQLTRAYAPAATMDEATVAARPPAIAGRTLDARPDTVDFRDRMFEPTLVEVPAVSDLDAYRTLALPVLDQGNEGACTGFGLAAVANFLARRRQFRAYRDAPLPDPLPPAEEASARMLYVLARRYDEWGGEDYEGSSARGAMKGWHKHGICRRALWEDCREPDRDLLTEHRASDALDRPLGAYFRVNHRDLVAMHAAITEVGVLYATARVHAGWNAVGRDGFIRFAPGTIGGHAFALVGYDREGFWLQNSWGDGWGKAGLARISYADWLTNGTDVWVARLGAPVTLGEGGAARMMAGAPRSYETYVYASLRPHIVMIGNEGRLKPGGPYGLTEGGLEHILTQDMPGRMAKWKTKRILLYAHGGLVAEDAAIQHAANHKQPALDAEVYPLSFIWRSDAWTTLGNILRDAVAGRRAEGVIDSAKDFMLDRLDDTLEPITRAAGGKALWDEMKENALLATASPRGGARAVADTLARLVADGAIDEIHLAGHSAGGIFMAALASYLATDGTIAGGPLAGARGKGLTIASLSLWAPACTMALFYQTYLPLLDAERIDRFALYTLKDEVERDDHCARIYNKSLLYLVSHAFERKWRQPFASEGEPLLGLARDVARTEEVMRVLRTHDWHLAPDGKASDARHHGDFDDDRLTLASTLARITGRPRKPIRRAIFSARSGEAIRQSLMAAAGERT
ncbi:MAG: C1 family peptidase [Sphingomonas sp.]